MEGCPCWFPTAVVRAAREVDQAARDMLLAMGQVAREVLMVTDQVAREALQGMDREVREVVLVMAQLPVPMCRLMVETAMRTMWF